MGLSDHSLASADPIHPQPAGLVLKACLDRNCRWVVAAPLRQSVVLLSSTLLLLPAGFGSGCHSDCHWMRFAAHQRVDCWKAAMMNAAGATMVSSAVQKKAKRVTKTVVKAVTETVCSAQRAVVTKMVALNWVASSEAMKIAAATHRRRATGPRARPSITG